MGATSLFCDLPPTPGLLPCQAHQTPPALPAPLVLQPLLTQCRRLRWLLLLLGRPAGTGCIS